jgi:hypothetical protein
MQMKPRAGERVAVRPAPEVDRPPRAILARRTDRNGPIRAWSLLLAPRDLADPATKRPGAPAREPGADGSARVARGKTTQRR